MAERLACPRTTFRPYNTSRLCPAPRSVVPATRADRFRRLSLGEGRGESKANLVLSGAPRLRACTVSLRDPEGVRHTVTVHAESLFEAAAHALAAFRKGWAADAHTPNAIIRVEGHLPSVFHDGPFRAIERRLRGHRGED
jgi:hypothetical protein